MQGARWASPSSVQGQESDSVNPVNPFQPGISHNSMNFAGCREIPSHGGKPSAGNVLQPFAPSGTPKGQSRAGLQEQKQQAWLSCPGISFQCHLKPVWKILIKPRTNKTSPSVLPTEHRAACRGRAGSQHQAQLFHLNPA